MKKIFTFFIAILMIISSLSMFACEKLPANVVYSGEVALIDVNGITSFDISTALKGKAKKAVSSEDNLIWKLKSVATNTEFTFDKPQIELEDIYKEYYLLEVYLGLEQIATAKLDFYDIKGDGIIWCEMSEYTVGAVRTDAPSEIGFEEVSEEFCEGQVIVAQPTDPRYWRFAYYAIMPFHSKEYYLKFTDYKTTFEIRYCRKAVYDRNSWNFDPDTMEHLDGVYAEPRSTINVRYFGCGGNVPSTGAQLNVQQTLTFRMVDILEKFEAIGKHGQGYGNYWYFVGTCHDKGNPYKITYFLQFIDVY